MYTVQYITVYNVYVHCTVYTIQHIHSCVYLTIYLTCRMKYTVCLALLCLVASAYSSDLEVTVSRYFFCFLSVFHKVSRRRWHAPWLFLVSLLNCTVGYQRKVAPVEPTETEPFQCRKLKKIFLLCNVVFLNSNFFKASWFTLFSPDLHPFSVYIQ